MGFLDSLAAWLSSENVKIVFVAIPGVVSVVAKKLKDSLEKRIAAARPAGPYISSYGKRAGCVLGYLDGLWWTTQGLILVQALLSLFLLPPALKMPGSWAALPTAQKAGSVIFLLGGVSVVGATVFLGGIGLNMAFGALKGTRKSAGGSSA